MLSIGVDSEFGISVRELVEAHSYRPTTTPLISNTPYHRPLDAERLANIDWSSLLAADDYISDPSLVGNRLLMNIYESDVLFLPAAGLAGQEREFTSFYDSRGRTHCETIRPGVESFLFDGLSDSVKVSGRWDCDALEAHVHAAIEEAVRGDRPVLRAIEEAVDPRRAAEMMIAQMALDGLTEATAMSQNLGGAYGVEQSELFKIFVDEFGYGVFTAKHSTLFADLCRSVGMSDEPHRYWFYYLPTWIAGNNYFYKVTRNRTEFFRYIGGMAFLEATFAPSFAAMAKTLRGVYGDAIDTRYCDEHAHIDQHHGRMSINDLLLPLARKHGDLAIRELVQGIEDVRLLGRLADQDLLEQLTWLPEAVAVEAPVAEGRERRLTADTPFETLVADQDTTVHVGRGSVEMHWTATGDSLVVPAGHSVRVPRGRLYGLRAPESATLSISTAVQ